MSFRNLLSWRCFAIALVLSFLIPPSLFPTLALRPSAQSGKQPVVKFQAANFHDDHEGKKVGLSRQDRIRETWVWHEANKRRLAETLGAEALAAEIPAQDIADIAVIQADNRIATPANAFDLAGRQVQFTPAGAGYTIAATSGGFDTNFGTKLDLTTAPAVNPKPGTEGGDDAYITQDLGFSFSIYGSAFTNVAVSSNGFLAFRPAGANQTTFDQEAVDSGESLAKLQTSVPRIAPYWHDLDARSVSTQGSSGIYIRKDNDRVVVTWNNIRDFPNDPVTDTGVHRFQVTLFNNGRIVMAYDQAQLTSLALAGISGGGSAAPIPTLVNLNNPSAAAITTPIAELFSTSSKVDEIAAVQAFYTSHPNNDVYDFVYMITDFQFDLGDAFAFYLPLRNDAAGIGQPVGVSSEALNISSQKIQGLLNLSNISQQYPASPITRFLGANHALSIMGQEQGHRWLSYISYPGSDPVFLLGRDDAHWNFFMNIESTASSPAAPRSSSAEGSVWRDNGNGSFTTTNLIDGFSRLDHYLMGLRPASDVQDTFVITNPSGTVRTRESNPFPNVNVTGTKQTVTMSQILQANGNRNPSSTTAQKNFRAAVVLLVQQGTQASQTTLDKVTRYRLAWESYFNRSCDGLATINTGLAELTTPRVIAAASAASFKPTLAAGEIAALFGVGLSVNTAVGSTQPLPTTLAGTQVLINGTAAPLFFVSPTQINFQVPRTTTATTGTAVNSATALIEVVSNGQLIRAGAFQIAPVVPALFTTNQSGTGNAAALDAFTFTPGPFNAKQSNGQPNIIAVFGTGLGIDVTDADGNAAASTVATMDGASVSLSYAGRAPGFIGLNQFNITFPATITSGNHTLLISRNGIATREVTIAVK
ncbi:MAG: hypothetical protein ACKVZH_14110 [Blastocatellia bacterium]